MDPPPGASPPMRMTASWLGSNDPTAYKSVARRCALMASSPRILNRPTHKYRADTEPTQKAPSQFIVPSRAQTSRRCETQAPRRPLVFLIVDLTGTRTRVLVDHVEQLDIICFGFRAAYRVLIY